MFIFYLKKINQIIDLFLQECRRTKVITSFGWSLVLVFKKSRRNFEIISLPSRKDRYFFFIKIFLFQNS